MKFELDYNVGKNYVLVSFDKLSHFREGVVLSFQNTFLKLGGVKQQSIDYWQFPKFINSEVISELIRNTCFMCGGLMKDGIALQQGVCYVDNSQGTVKYPHNESTREIKVRKCSSCGHSHT